MSFETLGRWSVLFRRPQETKPKNSPLPGLSPTSLNHSEAKTKNSDRECPDARSPYECRVADQPRSRRREPRGGALEPGVAGAPRFDRRFLPPLNQHRRIGPESGLQERRITSAAATSSLLSRRRPLRQCAGRLDRPSPPLRGRDGEGALWHPQPRKLSAAPSPTLPRKGGGSAEAARRTVSQRSPGGEGRSHHSHSAPMPTAAPPSALVSACSFSRRVRSILTETPLS